MALQPTVTSQGIKYIKVNKQDFNGLDLNVPLSQLDALRISYSNGTIGQYNLLGEPSEYPDYYLLRVSPNSSFTSSADNTITNYTAVASTGSGAIVTPSSFGETYVLNNLTVSSNPGGYLNGTTGVYDVPSLTNIPIIISSSVNATNPSGFGFAQTLILVIFSSLRGTLSTNSSVITAGNSGNVNSSYSGYMIEGEDITFQWGSFGFGGPLSVNSSTFYVTQSQAHATPSENLVILEPYNTTNFYNSDYNAIINNSEVNRLSSEYQLVDYATNQLTPVNFTQLIQGIGTRASVQDSNYTSYQYSGIRYWGSKNTTDNFNSPLTSQSLVVQTYQNDNLGLTTLGYASVNSFDTGIYEFAWGGGTYPEIATGGAVKLSQILNVDTTSSVGIISPLTDYFEGVVAQDLVPNSLPQFTQYSTTANIPNTARVMTTDFGVPTISSYMIGSAFGTGDAAQFSGNTIDFITNVSRVTTNSSGFYISGSTIPSATMSIEISNSLASGDRWFVTLYQDLPSPIQGTLEPLNSGSLNNYSIITAGAYNNPVLYNGVFEVSSSITAGSILTFYDNLPTNFGAFGDGGYGMLIWKAITDGTFVLFNGATLSGVGKGNLITSTASPTIKNNLTYITQTYGTNPSN